MKKSVKNVLLVFIALCVGLAIYSTIQERKITDEQKAKAKQIETEKLTKIEEKLRARFVKEDLAKRFKISEIEDENDILRVVIFLQFEPTTISQVRSITNSVCEIFYHELKAAKITRSISVHARRQHTGDLVKVYGNTFYSPTTGAFKFYKAK